MYSNHPAEPVLTERESVRLSDDAAAAGRSENAHAGRYRDGNESPVRAARRRNGAENRRIKAEEQHRRKEHGQGPVRRLLNSWWDRLLGAASERSFSSQEEEYAAHRTKRDYLWNTLGFGAWGMVFPILTIVVTQLVGVERAGMFSLAFVVATMLYFMGIYGVRTYQVSDLDGDHSFADYQVQRLLTVLAMVVCGYLFCRIRGYAGEMLTMSLGVVAFKAVDALGEVYEGRLQQVDKLYLGGISLVLRSVLGFVVFTVMLFITRDLGIASIAMAVAAAATLVLVTVPLAYFESPKSDAFSAASVGRIFKACFPLFIALFLFNLIDNMPKFMMDGVLSYDNQLYFNALYFPSQGILIVAGFIYKPLLVRMANAWADVDHRRKFDLFIVAMMAIIVVMTVAGVLLMGWIGIPIMSFLYGIDFSQLTTLSYIMLAAGGVTAGIDFLYQVITILRRQKVVTELYLITFVFALVVLFAMIHMQQLDGAVIGYLLTMTVLFILLLREYIVVRVAFARHPEAEPAPCTAPADDARGNAGAYSDGSYVVMFDGPGETDGRPTEAARAVPTEAEPAPRTRVADAYRRGRTAGREDATTSLDSEPTGKIAPGTAARPRALTPDEKQAQREAAAQSAREPMSVAERQRVIDEMNAEQREEARRRLERRRGRSNGKR